MKIKFYKIQLTTKQLHLFNNKNTKLLLNLHFSKLLLLFFSTISTRIEILGTRVVVDYIDPSQVVLNWSNWKDEEQNQSWWNLSWECKQEILWAKCIMVFNPDFASLLFRVNEMDTSWKWDRCDCLLSDFKPWA